MANAQANAKRNAILFLVGTIAVLAGLLLAMFTGEKQAGAIRAGTVLKHPRALQPFTLTDMNGAPYTLESMKGHWTLLFPGFTFCPDVCPTTLGMLRQVYAQLGDSADDVQMLFLSVDPQRDTPEKMRQYVQYFDPRFFAATTAEPELQRVAQMLGVAYVKVPGSQDGNYTMDHSAALVLLNPQGQIAAYFTPPHQVDALVHDLKQLTAP